MARPKAPKPLTEVQLEELQEKYLSTRDERYFQEMFTIIISYARSLVLKTTKNKIFLAPEVVDEAALDAAIKFMAPYKDPNKPNYRIAYSFAGVLRYKVLEAMYGDNKVQDDMTASLNSIIQPYGSDKTDTELGSLSESLQFLYLGRPETDFTDPADIILNQESFAIDSCVSVARDIFRASINLRSNVAITLGMILFIKKAKTYPAFRCQFLTEDEQHILDIALLEMRMRLTGEA